VHLVGILFIRERKFAGQFYIIPGGRGIENTRIAFQVQNVFSHGKRLVSNARNVFTQESKRSELPLTVSERGASLLWLQTFVFEC
jgi:hypothetical protein